MQSDQPLVSVVIPTFNRAYCLQRTLHSVLSQTYSRLEVIVVDDGSTDNTRELVLGRSGADPRIRYEYQTNRGVSAARNLGFRLARGEYIALLDSDDLWKAWKLELQLDCMRYLPQAGMIWTDMEAVDPQGRVSGAYYLRTMYHAYRWFEYDTLFSESYPLRQILSAPPAEAANGALYAGNIFSQMIMGNLVHTSTVLLRRDRLELVRGFDETLTVCGEDYDFHLRTCREGPVAFINVPTIQYQLGMPDQLTGSSSRIHMALNSLKTITAAIDRDGDKIRLPRKMLRSVFAGTHAWIGDAYREQGDRVNARRHFRRSLKYRPPQARTLALLLLASMPGPVGSRLTRIYRAAKNFFRLKPLA